MDREFNIGEYSFRTAKHYDGFVVIENNRELFLSHDGQEFFDCFFFDGGDDYAAKFASEIEAEEVFIRQLVKNETDLRVKEEGNRYCIVNAEGVKMNYLLNDAALYEDDGSIEDLRNSGIEVVFDEVGMNVLFDKPATAFRWVLAFG